jgi:hypothetical protein
VWLEAAGGFEARVLYEGDAGIWTVEACDLLAPYPGPEIMALDDEGRTKILVQYGGRTAAFPAVMDGTWLGGLAFGDADPRVEGGELNVGAQRGHLYQVVAHPKGGFDSVVIATFPGREVYSLVVADAFGERGGELLAGLSDGRLVHVAPPPDGSRRWLAREVHPEPGRIRQFAAFPSPRSPGRDALALVSRAGRAVLLEPAGGGFEVTVLGAANQGFARIAQGRERAHGYPTLYAIGDAGEVVRFEAVDGGEWSARTITFTPLGGRGIAAAELDDRNATDEILISGYSKRVVLLSRPAGQAK